MTVVLIDSLALHLHKLVDETLQLSACRRSYQAAPVGLVSF
jgi:hypothetical protein